ncbi:hypothetical protein ACOSP7_020714 [Xanthoceras sorbifolium]
MSCSPLYLSQSSISTAPNSVPISSIMSTVPNSAAVNKSILPTAHNNSAAIPNPATVLSSPQIFVELNPPQPCVPLTHPMITRFKSGSLKPKVFSAICKSPCSSLVCEPRLVKAALADPKCKRAMNEEYGALIKN